MEIRKMNYWNDRLELHDVIKKSFLTVAEEFNFTRETAPTNAAFLPIEKLDESVENNTDYFLAVIEKKIIGCVAIQPGRDEGEFYIERLGVLPEYRHEQTGHKLLNRAVEEIRIRNGKQISIGIINENSRLKNWYLKNGFIEKGTRKFDNLPFTVCFMGMPI